MSKTVYLLPTGTIQDANSNVALPLAPPGTGDIDEGIDGGTPNDSDVVATITNEWAPSVGSSSAFYVPLDDCPTDYGLGSTALFRGRCRIRSNSGDTIEMTGTISGTGSPSNTVTWDDTDTNDTWNTRATISSSITSIIPSYITGWVIAFYNSAWSRDMGSDGSYFEISCCEVEVTYSTVWETTDQYDWRWYDDDNIDIDSCTAHAAINTSYEVPIANLGTAHIIRFHQKIVNFSGGPNYVQLQYNKDSGGWNDVTPTSSNVRSIAGLPPDNDICLTELLTNEGGTFSAAGLYDESLGLTQFCTTYNLQANNETELAFCIEFRSADLSGGESIDFRLIEPSGGQDVVIGLGAGATTANATIETPGGDFLPYFGKRRNVLLRM